MKWGKGSKPENLEFICLRMNDDKTGTYFVRKSFEEGKAVLGGKTTDIE